MNLSHAIRLAAVADSEEILNIYAPYVSDTAVSFETEVPKPKEFAKRIEDIRRKYPYIVYLIDNKIVGYAYASSHRQRAAYCYDADASIYLLPECHGSGIAGKLYGCLFEILRELGYYNIYAGCSSSNPQSFRFHQKVGFTTVGTYHKVGYKFGKWYDVTWLEKSINDYSKEPAAVKSINDLSAEYLSNIFKFYISI